MSYNRVEYEMKIIEDNYVVEYMPSRSCSKIIEDGHSYT